MSSGCFLRIGGLRRSIYYYIYTLFLIYGFPFYLNNLYCCDIVLFADDTSLILKVDMYKYNEVNSALLQILRWFTVNNLVLNAKITKCREFTDA